MRSDGINVEELRSIVEGEYGSQVAERTLQHGGYTYQKNMLFDIDMGFGHVAVDTPLEYLKGVPEIIVPAARVSTALRQAGYFIEKAREIAGKKVSLQIGDNLYELPRQFSERNYYFSKDLDHSGLLPNEGVLYRFFVIENDIENILEKILDIRAVAEKLRHYTKTFQADIGSIRPLQSSSQKART